MKNVFAILALLMGLNASVVYADGIMAMFLFVSSPDTKDAPLRLFYQHDFHEDSPKMSLYKRLYDREIKNFAKERLPQMGRYQAEEALQASPGMSELITGTERFYGRRVPVFTLMQRVEDQTYLAVAFIDGLVLKTALKGRMEKLITDGSKLLGSSKLSKDIQLKLAGDYLAYEDKLMKIQEALNDTKAIMHKNIDDVIKRNENLDSLSEKALDLNDHAGIFKEKAKQMNSCCH